MLGKGQSLFAASISWRRTNPVFGKCEATAILPIRGRKTGSRRQQSLTPNRPTLTVQRRTTRTGDADFHLCSLARLARAMVAADTAASRGGDRRNNIEDSAPI